MATLANIAGAVKGREGHGMRLRWPARLPSTHLGGDVSQVPDDSVGFPDPKLENGCAGLSRGGRQRRFAAGGTRGRAQAF
ncbi:MAG: hypothetical protein JNL39_03605 [Opitutaceae bacterium]|nr:hypothetical protein [Opitutaceae bacterium]